MPPPGVAHVKLPSKISQTPFIAPCHQPHAHLEHSYMHDPAAGLSAQQQPTRVCNSLADIIASLRGAPLQQARKKHACPARPMLAWHCDLAGATVQGLQGAKSATDDALDDSASMAQYVMFTDSPGHSWHQHSCKSQHAAAHQCMMITHELITHALLAGDAVW